MSVEEASQAKDASKIQSGTLIVSPISSPLIIGSWPALECDRYGNTWRSSKLSLAKRIEEAVQMRRDLDVVCEGEWSQATPWMVDDVNTRWQESVSRLSKSIMLRNGP
jgi:hypothetical protein